MPRPVLAFPWGSRSTTSTRSPCSASAAPRFTAVVVLPTPPFWLAIASTAGRLSGSALVSGSGRAASGSGSDGVGGTGAGDSTASAGGAGGVDGAGSGSAAATGGSGGAGSGGASTATGAASTSSAGSAVTPAAVSGWGAGSGSATASSAGGASATSAGAPGSGPSGSGPSGSASRCSALRPRSVSARHPRRFCPSSTRPTQFPSTTARASCSCTAGSRSRVSGTAGLPCFTANIPGERTIHPAAWSQRGRFRGIPERRGHESSGPVSAVMTATPVSAARRRTAGDSPSSANPTSGQRPGS